MAEDKRTSLQRYWASQIGGAKKREDNWQREGDDIVKLYRNGGSTSNSTANSTDVVQHVNRFNILWSNTEIMKAATLSSISRPNVTRRYKDDNKVTKDAAEVLERALEFIQDEEIFTRNLRKSRDDMLLPGRGTIWYEYDADFAKVPMEVIERPPQVDEAGELVDSEVINQAFMLNGVETEPDGFDGDTPFMEVMVDQRITPKYVYWKDYKQSDSRSEEDVWWKARRHGLSVDELTALLADGDEDKARKIIDKFDVAQTSNDEKTDILEVWEIWSKPNRKRIWYTETANDILEEEDVPLQLTTFFPCPKPLFAFETTNTMVPVPVYRVYAAQATDLNIIVTRLSKLTSMAKVAGVYSGASKDVVVDLDGLSDGNFKPIKDAANFGQTGAFSGMIWNIPLQEIASVIDILERRKAIIKAEITEIIGLSDLIRGDTNANETATAQRLKGSFGSLRLRPLREPMEEFIRDGYRIMGEIIADKFEQSTLQRMTGEEVSNEVMQLLRNDTMRDFRVDVETDSTVQPNEMIDQQRAVEYTTAVGGMIQQLIPLIQAFPPAASYAMANLQFVARQFKAGRDLEDELNRLADVVEKAAQQSPQQEQDPEAQAKAIDAQIEQAKLQLEQLKLAAAAQKTQTDNQTKLAIAQINSETKQMEVAGRARDTEVKAQADIAKNVLDVQAARQ